MSSNWSTKCLWMSQKPSSTNAAMTNLEFTAVRSLYVNMDILWAWWEFKAPAARSDTRSGNLISSPSAMPLGEIAKGTKPANFRGPFVVIPRRRQSEQCIRKVSPMNHGNSEHCNMMHWRRAWKVAKFPTTSVASKARMLIAQCDSAFTYNTARDTAKLVFRLDAACIANNHAKS